MSLCKGSLGWNGCRIDTKKQRRRKDRLKPTDPRKKRIRKRTGGRKAQNRQTKTNPNIMVEKPREPKSYRNHLTGQVTSPPQNQRDTAKTKTNRHQITSNSWNSISGPKHKAWKSNHPTKTETKNLGGTLPWGHPQRGQNPGLSALERSIQCVSCEPKTQKQLTNIGLKANTIKKK